MVLYYNGNLFEGMFKDGVTHGKGKFIGYSFLLPIFIGTRGILTKAIMFKAKETEWPFLRRDLHTSIYIYRKAGLYYEGWITDGKKNGAGTCKL